MHFPVSTLSLFLSASTAALLTGVTATATTTEKRATLQGLLLERQEIAQFFDPSNHNTPRHASAPLDNITSHHHHRRRRHHHHKHHHSKRGQCMKRTKAVAAVASPSDTSELAQHRGQGTAATDYKANDDGSSSSSSSDNRVELKPTDDSKSNEKEKDASDDKPTSSSSSSSKQAKPTDKGNVSPISPNSGSALLGGVGLYTFVDKTCGKSGAIEDVTKTAGPNGAMDWLNCGLDGNGWTPPDVKLEDVLVMQLDEALEDPNSPFQACKPFLDIFDKYAKVNDVPAILLASIAMQESTCNPNASGDNGGAYGLMQITGDKCTKGISCSDPDYNVKTGAAYIKSRLDANNGNILLAMGEYNGWYKGLTIAKATAIKDSCCECQNNVNYHMQMLNGWFLNKDGYSLGDWSMGC